MGARVPNRVLTGGSARGAAYVPARTDRQDVGLAAEQAAAPGVYTYRTTGGEGLNLVGMQRSFPSTTSMIVADGHCATISWVPITQHTEATMVCSADGGALEIPKLVTDESIAGTNNTSTIVCPSGAYLLPPSVHPGERWGVTCSLTNPAEKVAMKGLSLAPRPSRWEGIR